MQNRPHVILMLHTCQGFQMIFCLSLHTKTRKTRKTRRQENKIPHARFLKIYFLSENSIQYIFIKLFPAPQLLPDLPHSLPTQIRVLFLIQTIKIKQKATKIIGCDLCWPTSEKRPCLKGGWSIQSHSTEEIFSPRSYHLGITSWLRVEHYCPLPLLYPRFLSGVNLFRSCANCYSLCEIVCVSLPWCLEDGFLGVSHHLWFLQSSCPLFCTDLWALRGGVWWRHPAQAGAHSKISYPLYVVQLWLFCVSYHLW